MNQTNVENNLLSAVRTYLAHDQPRIDFALVVIGEMPDGAAKNAARGLVSKHLFEHKAFCKAFEIALQMTASDEKNEALGNLVMSALDSTGPLAPATMFRHLFFMVPGAAKDRVIGKFVSSAVREYDDEKVLEAIAMMSVDEEKTACLERRFKDALASNNAGRATRALSALGRKARPHEREELPPMVLEHGSLQDFERACALCNRDMPTADELGTLAEKAAKRLELNHALAAIKKMVRGPAKTRACWAMVNAFSQLDYGQLEFINDELAVVPLMPEEERGKAYAVLMAKCLSMGMTAIGSRVAEARGTKFTDAEIERFVSVNRKRHERYDGGELSLVKEMVVQEKRIAIAKQLLAFHIEWGQLENALEAAKICGVELIDAQIMAMIKRCRYNQNQVVRGLSLLKNKLSAEETRELLFEAVASRT
jgi:hypothetical protein